MWRKGPKPVVCRELFTDIQANIGEGFSSLKFFISGGVRKFVIIWKVATDFNAVCFIWHRMKPFIAQNKFQSNEVTFA